MEKLFIGIDIGTSVSKGVLLDEKGCVIRMHSIRHAYSAEIDFATSWWIETCEIIRKLTDDIRKELLESITVSAMAPNLIFLDANGSLVRKTILFTDEFALETQKRLDGQDGTRWMNESISKLIDIKKTENHWEDCAHLLTTHSYIAYKLSGVLYCDKATAYEYGHVFSRKLGQWDDTFLSNYGINASLLPPVIPPGCILGQILPCVADELELPKSIYIVSGSHDSVASIIGSGLQEKGDVFIYYGTFNCSATLHSDVVDVLEGGIDCSPIEWTVSVPAAGPQFDQMCRIFTSDFDYSAFERCANKSQCGAKGLVFLQHDCLLKTGIGSKPRGAFYNISIESDKNDFCRAVFESFPYAISAFWRSEKIACPSQCYIAGGGAGSDLRVQLVSDILGITQIKLNNCENAVGTSLIGMFAYSKQSYIKIQNQRRQAAKEYRSLANAEEREIYRNNSNIYYALLSERMSL